MKTTDFLKYLQSLDIILWAEGDRLRYNAPSGAITEEIRSEMVRRKPELLQLLREKAAAEIISHQPLRPVDRSAGALPLSFAQERLWFLTQLDPNSPFFNEAVVLRSRGTLDVSALRQSLNEIVRRHEILRTTFTMVDGRPMQTIAPQLELLLPIIDLRHLPPTERENEIQRQSQMEAQRPFDLSQGPLIRSTLLHADQDDYVLFLTMHHIVTDAWSWDIFMRELAVLYEAFRQGQPVPLPPLPIQYADFAAWQRQHLQGPVLDALLTYWRTQLGGDLPMLDLPTDHLRPPTPSFRGDRCAITLGPELSARLRAFCRAEEATLFMALVAACQALFFRITGQPDIIIGTRIAGRSRPQTEPLIGFFINALVLRTNFADQPSFRTLLRRVRSTALDAYAHQSLPFEKLVEVLQPERSTSRQPLFTVMVVVQNAPTTTLQLPGLQFDHLGDYSGSAKYDLDFSFAESEGQIVGTLEYSTDLFTAATITRLVAQFQTLLAAMLAQPDQALTGLPLLPTADLAQLAAWGQTEHVAPLSDDLPLSAHLRAALQQQPTAIRLHDGPRQLTAQALDELVERIAALLASAQIGPGMRVGVALPRSVESIAALLAVLDRGAVYVPLPPSTTTTLTAACQTLTLAAVIAPPELAQTLAGPVTALALAPAHLALVATGPLPPPVTEAPSTAALLLTDLAQPAPAGVRLTQTQLQQQALWQQASVASDAATVLSHAQPPHSWLGLLEVLGGLLLAAPIVVVPPAADTDLRVLEQTVAAGQVTRVLLPAPTLAALLGAAVPLGQRLPRVRQWDCVGAPLSLGLARRFQVEVPGARLVARWGTPALGEVLHCALDDLNTADRSATDGLLPLGRPVTGYRVQVCDPQGQVVPVGVPGQLVVQASSPADRPVVHTDLIVRYRADGVLTYAGATVNLRGYQIPPAAIAGVLAGHPAVREATVAVWTDGTGRARLIGYVALWPTSNVTGTALRQFVKEQVADYLVPEVVLVLAELPRTPAGTIDEPRLPTPTFGAEPIADPSPETVITSSLKEPEVIEVIAKAWKEVLYVEKVGIDDNFFDIGGHSVLMASVHVQLEEELGIEIPITELFEYPTIRALARHLVGTTNDENSGGTHQVQAEHLKSLAQTKDAEIAIIGLAGRFPSSRTLQDFWENLRDGKELITFFSDEELLASGVDHALVNDPHYVKAGAILDDVESFDASFFGLTPREAEIIDPQQRLFLECAWEAFENAGYDVGSYQGKIGVFAGISRNFYFLSHLYGNPELNGTVDRFQLSTANEKDYLATRVAYKLNLRGPSVNVQTACSTSLVAVHLACRSLQFGECSMALAGGVSITIPQKLGYLYEAGNILSPDGHCRTFDAEARGTVFGNGVGMVVLKRLEDALADGDTILAVIKGSAINNDGSSKVGYTAPSVEGQTEVIAEALAAAGVPAETISYIEAHGTGTALGDPIEIAALTKAFRVSTPKTGFCAIGSVKTNIGHIDVAAGIAGLIKTVLALQHQQIPPSLHFSQPNPQIDFAATPFFVNTTQQEWPRSDHPRRAGVSSFGFGGTNAHVILEEAPPAAPSVAPGHPAQLLLLSARTPSALATASANLADHLAQHPELALADVAATLQRGRRAFRQRRALVVTDHAQAIAALRSDDARPYSAPEALPQRPVVFLFPGQGAQHVGMGQDLYHSQPRFRAVVDQCAALLTPQIGLDLRSLLYPSGDPTAAAARLTETDLGQVALFVVNYALAQQWIAWGVQPAAMIGHSLGEYVTACLAGVFSLEVGLRLVVQRGKLMHAQPQGSMLAVDLPAAVLAPRLPAEVTVAVESSAESCVVAGPSDAVAALAATLTQEGVGHQPVATTHAFHSALMDGAVAGLTAAAAATPLAAPTIPYISTVSGTWITAAEATDAQYWGRQLRAPVRLATGLATVATLSGAILLEVGPGQAMSSLARRQRGSDQVVVASMRHRADTRDDVVVLLEALGQFWVAGGTVDWARFHANQPRRRVPLPTYPFERQRYWIERPAVPERSTRAATGKQPDIAEWFYVPSWQRTLVPRTATTASLASATESWLVLMDEQGLGATLVTRLRAAGASVVAVQAGNGYAANGAGHYVVDPTAVADYQQLLHTLRAQGQLPSQILQLWGLASEGSAALHQGLGSMVALMQALGAEDERGAMRWWVIGHEALEVESHDVVRPEQALVLGSCRVIPQEYAGMQCRYVDIAFTPGDAAGLARVANQVLAEIASAADEPVVAYRGAIRWVQTYQRFSVTTAPGNITALRSKGVYLIIGGLNSIGSQVALYLAEKVQARLILIAPESTTDIQQISYEHARDADQEATEDAPLPFEQWQQLTNLGASVLAYRADMSNPRHIREVLAQAHHHYSELHGVFYCAGIAEERLLRAVQELDLSEYQDYFTTKFGGLTTIGQILQDSPLDFAIVNTSLSSVLGGVAFVCEASLGSAVEAFVVSLNRTASAPWIAINWDTLQYGNALLPQSSELSRFSIAENEVPQALEYMLANLSQQQLIVSTGDLMTRFQRGGREGTETQLASPQHGSTDQQGDLHPRPRLSVDYMAPISPLEQEIVRIWERSLRIEPIGTQDNFFDLGGDSLIAIRVVAQINKALNLNLPSVIFYQKPSVKLLADLIEDGERIAKERVDKLSERREAMIRRKQYHQRERSRRLNRGGQNDE